MDSEYMCGMNERQIAAANHKYGPALVLAGPGSGKTSVITARAVNLVRNNNAEPSRLLTVTFSRAAAAEMQKRYMRKNNRTDSEIPEYSTIHSFCLRSLMYSDKFIKKKRRLLCDSGDKNKILSDIWNRINASEYGLLTFEYLELISGTISKIKCFNGTEKESDIRKNIQIRNFDEIFNEYESYKRNNNMIDFDDMLSIMFEYLAEDSSFRKKISDKYDYIQVDEGQDLSYLQVEIIKSVCPHGNVFMVADDDQGIYGFRGADVNVLKHFEELFKGCRKYYLEQNYRSCKRIVTTASSFISKNTERYGKNIFTQNSEDANIELIRAYDVIAQARLAAEIACANSAADLTCGILYRKNISALMPLLFLHKMSERKGIKAAFGISGDFVQPEKYEIVSDYIASAALNDEKSFIKSKSMKEIFRDMEKNGKIAEYRDLQALKGRCEKDTEYILCFTEVISRVFKSYRQAEDFLERIKQKDTAPDIFFSTVHSSKGLEYDCVVIIDASEEDFPKKTAESASEIEEERRLFYVAMTRAKKKLYIVTPGKCGNIKCAPGLFFRETEELLRHKIIM